MRILLLSDANSIHTIRWVKGLNKLGITIGLWSINKPNKGIYDDCKEVEIFFSEINQKRVGFISKIKYLTLLRSLKKTIKKFKPDILHAHYASSFGLLGALSGFKPFIISVWGSDVFDFPRSNFLFKALLKYNLYKADSILSTSHVMAKETLKYTKKDITVIPFGVDTELFKRKDQERKSKKFIIGTIKTLEEKYGIRYLIEAFYIFHERYPHIEKELLIAGGGSLESDLKEFVKSLGIGDLVNFKGVVPYSEVPKIQNDLDVCCCLSILDSESFGVAAVEASSVETPVIVSNVGGLPEVILHNVSGLVVPRKNPKETADAIELLFLNDSLRRKMGKEGRKRVLVLYDWQKNLEQMFTTYEEILKRNSQ